MAKFAQVLGKKAATPASPRTADAAERAAVARKQAEQAAASAARAAEQARGTTFNGGYKETPRLTPVTTSVPTPATPAGGGGGGAAGGGGGAVAGAASPISYPSESLDDYISKNFLYTSQLNENQRDMDDYDAETLRSRQTTEADQAVRRASLQRALADAGQDNAEDFAGRGLGRSGLVFKAQDEISARGVEQDNSIAKTLTDLIAQRGQGRIAQEKAGRGTLAQVMQKLTDDYNARQTAALGGS